MTSPSPDEAADAATDVFLTQFVKHRHALFAFIAKQLVNPADVEDVFQKTTVVMWKKMCSFDPQGSFFHWACGIAFNEVRNFLTVQRRSKLHFDVELVELLAEEAVGECELTTARLSALNGCMARLSPRQQEIIRRCYMGTETITDVAKGMGRERGALYKQLARLRQKLLDCVRLQLNAQGAEG